MFNSRILIVAAPVIAFVALIGVSSSAQAAVGGTWSGSGADAFWATTGNWDNGIVASGYGNTATFNRTVTITNPNVGANIQLGTIVFDTAAASAFSIGGTSSIQFADGTTTIITMTSTVATTQVISAPFTLGTAIAGNSTITNSSTRTLTISGNITGGSGGTAAGKTLTITGSGPVTLSGVLAKGGASTLTISDQSTGTLKFGGNSTLTTLNITQPGATVDLNGSNISFSNTGSTILNASNNATVQNGTMTFTSGAALNYADFGATAGGTLTLASNVVLASSAAIGVDFYPTGGTIVINNTANTFSGTPDIFCTVKVPLIGNSGSNSSLGTNGTIVLGNAGNSGTLVYTGTGETTNKAFNFNSSTAAIALDMSGTGTLWFNATGNITNSGAGAKTLTFQGSTAGVGRFDANLIDNTGTNKLNVAKAGTGTWQLYGNNTYTGTTAINGGALFVNGVHTGTGAVTVAATTTLGGKGTLAGATAVTGTLSPGEFAGTTGTLTINSTISFNAGSVLSLDLNTDQTTGGGINDLISTNTLPVSGGTTTINVCARLSLGGRDAKWSSKHCAEILLIEP